MILRHRKGPFEAQDGDIWYGLSQYGLVWSVLVFLSLSVLVYLDLSHSVSGLFRTLKPIYKPYKWMDEWVGMLSPSASLLRAPYGANTNTANVVLSLKQLSKVKIKFFRYQDVEVKYLKSLPSNGKF